MTCPRCGTCLLFDEEHYCLRCGYRENVPAEGLEDPELFPEDGHWNTKLQSYHRNPRRERPARICEVCGQEYPPSYHYQRTCGRRCGQFLSHGISHAGAAVQPGRQSICAGN